MNCFDIWLSDDILCILTDYNKVLCAFLPGSHNYQGSSSSFMAGFAYALALDVNEIHVEMHIELCYSLSRYREYHRTIIYQSSSSSHMAGFAFVLALDTNQMRFSVS